MVISERPEMTIYDQNLLRFLHSGNHLFQIISCAKASYNNGVSRIIQYLKPNNSLSFASSSLMAFSVLASVSILSIQHLGIVKELIDSHQNNTLIIPS